MSTRFVHTAPVLFPTLERALVSSLARLRKENPLTPITLLLGSKALMLWLQRRIAAEAAGYYMVEFATLEGVISNYAEKTCKFKMPGGAMHLLMEKFFSEHEHHFEHIVNKEGLFKALTVAIRELHEASPNPMFFLEQERPQEKTICDFLDYYKRHIALGGFADTEQRYWLAHEEICRDKKEKEASILLCYGMYDFNYAQQKILEGFFCNFTQTHFFLPEQKNKIYLLPRRTLFWLKRLGFSTISHAHTYKHPLQKLLVPGHQEGQKEANKEHGPRLEMFSQRNDIYEVEEIARKILSACKNDGFFFSDIAIILRNTSTYRKKITATFQKHGIPFRFDGGKKFSDTSVYQGLALFLRLAYTNFSREDVLELLIHGNLDYEALGCPSPHVYVWEYFTILADIMEGKHTWNRSLRMLIPRLKKYEPDEDKQAKLKLELEFFIELLKKIFSDIKKITDSKEPVETAQAIRHIMKYFPDSKEPDSKEKEEVFSVLEKLLGLQKLDIAISAKSFLYIFLDELKSTPLRESKGGVFVSDIMKFRGMGYPIVFIPGIGEKQFPKLRSEDPIFTDTQRRALIRKGLMLQLKKRENGEEELLFLNAVYAAEKRLFLSYSERDVGSNKERAPSFYFIQAQEFAEKSSVSDYLCAEEKDLKTLDGFIKKQEKRNPIPYLMSGHEFLRRSRERYESVWQTEEFSEFEGCIKSDGAIKLLKKKFGHEATKLSPTKLEAFAKCPYNFFLSSVLSLEETTKPSLFTSITPPQKGVIYHTVLFNLFEELINEKQLPINDINFAEIQTKLGDIIKRCFDNMENFQNMTCLPVLLDIEKQEIRLDLQELIKREKGNDSIPVQLEFRFGKTSHKEEESSDSTDNYLPYNSGGASFLFSGKMDRVDKAGSGYRIIDYKTGKSMSQSSIFAGGENLQLPVYILAAEEFLKINGDVEARYFYISRKEGFKYKTFSSHKFDEHKKEFNYILDTLANLIGKGSFFPYPRAANCRVCKFRPVCSRDVDNLFVRKKGIDTKTQSFLEVKGIP